MLEFSDTIKSKIFSIQTDTEFNDLALDIFYYQSKNNKIYKQFLKLINCNPTQIKNYRDIPFLPIQFFKSLEVVVGTQKTEKIFKSSGTTATGKSKHLVSDLSVYEASFISGFSYFYGDIEEYTVLALLPNYLEQGDSSLVYMVDKLIDLSQNKKSKYCLDNLSQTRELLLELSKKNQKVLLIGVSYALLDLLEKGNLNLNENFVIMETGGMKGRRKELTKQELHTVLKKGFGVDIVHSEYGMTELLSQAYAKKNAAFKTPPWMKVLIRDINDPLSFQTKNKSGGINIIDLANVNSCSFIATQDLGKINTQDNSFEILGRFDYSDTRGCNLLMAGD